jgi:Helix-turn-helix.
MPDTLTLKKAIAAIKYKFSLNQAGIAQKMGINKTYLSSVINGNETLSELFLDKLHSTFQISKSYLNTGEGVVFEEKANLQSEPVSMSREVFDQITRLTKTVLSQQRTIESMQGEHKKMLARMGNVAISAVAGK